MLVKIIIIHHIHVLSQCAGELYTLRMDLADKAYNIVHEPTLNAALYNSNSTTAPINIPVKLSKNAGTVFATVSPEDYPRIVQVSPCWRLNAAGYVITVKRIDGKFNTTFMHKLILGRSGRHLDGNRLNNTRDNLVPKINRSIV